MGIYRNSSFNNCNTGRIELIYYFIIFFAACLTTLYFFVLGAKEMKLTDTSIYENELNDRVKGMNILEANYTDESDYYLFMQ